MLILPDFTILQILLHKHSLWALVPLLLSLLLSTWYLRLAFRSAPATMDRFLHGAMALSAAGHFLLLASLFLVVAIIRWFASDHAQTRRAGMIFLWAAAFLAGQLLIWSCIILLLSNTTPDSQLGFFVGVRKLFSYPKIYEKFFVPVVKNGILPEVILATGAAFLVLWRTTDSKKESRQSWGFCLLLLFLCIAASSIPQSLYNHIRYFYYLYPLLLILLAFFIVQCGNWLTSKSNIAAWSGFVMLGIYLGWSITQSWNTVVTARPGMIEPFTYQKIRLDHKTCCSELEIKRATDDYVIDFGRPNESAVYCGKINASLRTILPENRQRATHYITGSLFFADPSGLASLIQSETEETTDIWILASKAFLPINSWPGHLLNDLEPFKICQADDRVTALYFISSRKLLHNLALFF